MRIITNKQYEEYKELKNSFSKAEKRMFDIFKENKEKELKAYFENYDRTLEEKERRMYRNIEEELEGYKTTVKVQREKISQLIKEIDKIQGIV